MDCFCCVLFSPNILQLARALEKKIFCTHCHVTLQLCLYTTTLTLVQSRGRFLDCQVRITPQPLGNALLFRLLWFIQMIFFFPFFLYFVVVVPSSLLNLLNTNTTQHYYSILCIIFAYTLFLLLLATTIIIIIIMVPPTNIFSHNFKLYTSYNNKTHIIIQKK